MNKISESGPIIVWFRQDLRISDHAALHAASQTGAPIIPLFILDKKSDAQWTTGRASLWWLEGSLRELNIALKSLNSRLILRRGKPQNVLDNLLDEITAQAVYFTRRYEPENAAEDQSISEHLRDKGIECRRFSGSLLFEPDAIAKKTGGAFRVFTPFYKTCLAMETVKNTLPAPKNLMAPETWPKSERLKHWKLRPIKSNGDAGFKDRWRPGTVQAYDVLKEFTGCRISKYTEDRNRPDRKGTSGLSPYLHFGEISPREIWNFVTRPDGLKEEVTNGNVSFLRELIWREFSYHLLWHWPHITHLPFNKNFEGFPWRDDERALKAWQSGSTGYPIVDAGMRELWQTGWMHNRVRMVVASFLTKHLLIPWQEGARWFWDTLVDADLANNSASWQWVAGCGADASPYFRIFNPILQGQKFDPQGRYVRQWVPELADLPNRYIHVPWESGTRIFGYPAPLVEHQFARRRALDSYAKITVRQPK
jgi:deoxyribodipyrimidine photo-lyase